MSSFLCLLLRHVLAVLATPQGQQRPDVRDVLDPFEEGDEVQEIVVRWVADPALYRYGIVWSAEPCQNEDGVGERENGEPKGNIASR